MKPQLSLMTGLELYNMCIIHAGDTEADMHSYKRKVWWKEELEAII